MSNQIYIASYPRSGNTLMRMILWHCFGIASTSAHEGDVEAHDGVPELCGHVHAKPHANGMLEFSQHQTENIRGLVGRFSRVTAPMRRQMVEMS